MVQNWPGAGINGIRHKVPSRIAYKEENLGKRNYNSPHDTWGHQIKAGWKSYAWTKLLLDPQNPSTAFDDPTLQSKLGNLTDGILQNHAYKSPEEITADFLRFLYGHCMKILEKRYKHRILKHTSIEFWFTHPAIWSEMAKHSTLRAAQRAGFGTRECYGKRDTVKLISEPEAAAIAALRTQNPKDCDERVCLLLSCTASFSGSSAYSCQVGTGVLICDCGGGTIVS